MKLLKYIVLVIIVGLIILRLLYINAFGNIHLPHVDALHIIAALVVILAFFFAFWIMKVEEKFRREKNDIWDALCALRDGHNNNYHAISKLLNKGLTDEVKDFQKSLDSLYRTENQAKDNIIDN